jgi:hypothetical protein
MQLSGTLAIRHTEVSETSLSYYPTERDILLDAIFLVLYVVTFSLKNWHARIHGEKSPMVDKYSVCIQKLFIVNMKTLFEIWCAQSSSVLLVNPKTLHPPLMYVS